MKLRFEIEQGEAGLLYMVSPDRKGFLAAGTSIPDVMKNAGLCWEALNLAEATEEGKCDETLKRRKPSLTIIK